MSFANTTCLKYFIYENLNRLPYTIHRNYFDNTLSCLKVDANYTKSVCLMQEISDKNQVS